MVSQDESQRAQNIGRGFADHTQDPPRGKTEDDGRLGPTLQQIQLAVRQEIAKPLADIYTNLVCSQGIPNALEAAMSAVSSAVSKLQALLPSIVTAASRIDAAAEQLRTKFLGGISGNEANASRKLPVELQGLKLTRLAEDQTAALSLLSGIDENVKGCCRTLLMLTEHNEERRSIPLRHADEKPPGSAAAVMLALESMQVTRPHHHRAAHGGTPILQWRHTDAFQWCGSRRM